MGVGCLAVVVPVGGILGLIAGYYNGRFISNFIMRLADVFLALPGIDFGYVRIKHYDSKPYECNACIMRFVVALVHKTRK